MATPVAPRIAATRASSGGHQIGVTSYSSDHITACGCKRYRDAGTMWDRRGIGISVAHNLCFDLKLVWKYRLEPSQIFLMGRADKAIAINKYEYILVWMVTYTCGRGSNC